MSTYIQDGAMAVYAIPAPPYLEAATIPLHDFVSAWDSPRTQDFVLSSLRAIMQHPMCDPDSLSPAHVGINLLSGTIHIICVDDAQEIAFVATRSLLPGAETFQIQPPVVITNRLPPGPEPLVVLGADD